MEKIPLYGSFKKFLTTQKEQIKNAWENKEWGWLLGFLIVVVVTLSTTIFIVIGSVVNGFEAIGILKNNIFEPKRQLLYEMNGESQKNDAGQYVTVFTLKLFDPKGNLNKFVYTYPKGCSKDSEFIDGGTVFKEGILYAVSNYKVTCVTKEPIRDSHKLFKLKD